MEMNLNNRLLIEKGIFTMKGVNKEIGRERSN
jgi:hypothetical protein